MVRPGYLVALLATLLVAGFNLAFTAASRAREQRTGAAVVSAQRSVRPLRPITHAALARTEAPGARAERRDAAPRRPAAPSPVELLRVRAGKTVALQDRPGGRAIAKLAERTEFGSRTILSVVSRRGPWARVLSSELRNGQAGWVDMRGGTLERGTTDARITVRLSSRRVELRVRGRLVRRVTVAIGRPGSETPRGRFAVTDKIAGSRFGPYYGCCILALTGHQPNTPPGWTGGDRLAIHGTNAPASIGKPASAGCLRASEADLRALMRSVPLGTPVYIRS
jgi:lipoprotein-anchoring transpeptidase ErfK/SrfK